MKIMSIVAALAVSAISLQVQAADDVDMAKTLKELRTSTASARVVISDPLTLYVAKLTEQEMNRYGCAYPVTDPQELLALFDLLERARIEVAPPFYRSGPEPRVGVYFSGSDGSKHKFLFTGAGPWPQQEYGTYDETVHIQAKNKDFSPELRAWALERNPVRGIACKPENFLPVAAPQMR